jgi:hypothetical protein
MNFAKKNSVLLRECCWCGVKVTLMYRNQSLLFEENFYSYDKDDECKNVGENSLVQ